VLHPLVGKQQLPRRSQFSSRSNPALSHGVSVYITARDHQIFSCAQVQTLFTHVDAASLMRATRTLFSTACRQAEITNSDTGADVESRAARRVRPGGIDTQSPAGQSVKFRNDEATEPHTNAVNILLCNLGDSLPSGSLGAERLQVLSTALESRRRCV
jgi:hypothetical protein